MTTTEWKGLGQDVMTRLVHAVALGAPEEGVPEEWGLRFIEEAQRIVFEAAMLQGVLDGRFMVRLAEDPEEDLYQTADDGYRERLFSDGVRPRLF